MNLIVAVDMNWGIGKDNELLAHLPSDLKSFKELTEGNIVVMGRKTLESLPNGALSNRTNIVLSKDISFENWERFAKKQAILMGLDNFLEACAIFNYSDNVFVIGGGQIYTKMLPYCDTAYITMMYHEFDADTYIPNIGAMDDWELTSSGELIEENGIEFRHLIYQRKI